MKPKPSQKGMSHAGLLDDLQVTWPAQSIPPYGPCLLIPNKAYRPEWTSQLEREGCRVMNTLDGHVYAFVKLNTPPPAADTPTTKTISGGSLKAKAAVPSRVYTLLIG